MSPESDPRRRRGVGWGGGDGVGVDGGQEWVASPPPHASAPPPAACVVLTDNCTRLFVVFLPPVWQGGEASDEDGLALMRLDEREQRYFVGIVFFFAPVLL